MDTKSAIEQMGRREEPIPSSDVETDKMEDMDDRESDLERLSKRKSSDDEETPVSKPKKIKRGGRRSRGSESHESQGAEESHETEGSEAGPAESGSGHSSHDLEHSDHSNDEDDEGNDSEEAEDSQAKKEDLEREQERVDAMGALKEIEIDFAHLKDRLYETQMKKLEFELKLCEMNKHPDFVYFMKLIDDNFNSHIQQSINMQKYKLRCLDNQTRAYRVAIHQQYIKLCEDLKYKEIRHITSDWYEINKERRTMDTAGLDSPGFYQYNRHISAKNVRSQDSINELVCQRNALYKELSNLQGITKYQRAFPSALNYMKGCEKEDIDADLAALKKEE